MEEWKAAVEALSSLSEVQAVCCFKEGILNLKVALGEGKGFDCAALPIWMLKCSPALSPQATVRYIVVLWNLHCEDSELTLAGQPHLPRVCVSDCLCYIYIFYVWIHIVQICMVVNTVSLFWSDLFTAKSSLPRFPILNLLMSRNKFRQESTWCCLLIIISR